MMKPMSTDELRKVLLDIASFVHEICEEHGLVYILQGGSLLGAVRHKGFIPWDHDFDIMMPRYDYEQFVEHFDEWCGNERYKIMAPRLGNSPYFFAKVYDTNTYVKQLYIDDAYCLGAWLDIFPLDGYPGEEGDRVRQQVRKAKRVVYTTITDVNTGSSKTIKAMKKIVTPLARRVINPYKIVTATDNYVRKQSTVPTSMLASYMSTWSFVLKCPIEHVFDRTLLPFEDRVYWGPRDYEGYLEIEFGKNWRTPICDGQHIVEEACYFLE